MGHDALVHARTPLNHWKHAAPFPRIRRDTPTGTIALSAVGLIDNGKMIRNRRPRRGTLHEHRREILLVAGGALLAAALAGGIPAACSTLAPPEDAIIDQIEDLAKEADQRDSSRR